MRLSVSHNRILVRAQAAFVALIYVFLCTFGTLTHVHSGAEDSAVQTATAEHPADTLAIVSPNDFVAASVTSLPTPVSTHCPFCEWQANTLGRISTPDQTSIPTSVACVYVRCGARIAPVFTTLSTSRAPPAV